MQKCVICKLKTLTVEEHHIVPRAAGGVDMPTILICANCHSALHRSIVQAMAKKPSQAKYFTDEQMSRAKPLIELAIVHIRRARENPDQRLPVSLYLKPERRVVELLHLLKSDAGFTNLNDFCIHILKTYIVAKLNSR